MEKQTVHGIYDHGEMRLTEPVHRDGVWRVEITFVEQVDEESVPIERDPHRFEAGSLVDRMDDYQRHVDDKHTRPVF